MPEIKSFFGLLYAEFYKSLKFKGFWVVLILVFLLVTFKVVSLLVLDLNKFNNLFNRSIDTNKWIFYYNYLLLIVSWLMPFMIGLLVSVGKYMEVKANGWKQLNSLPFSITYIHVAKITVLFIFMLLLLVIIVVIVIFSAEFVAIFRPDFGFNEFDRQHNYIFKLFFHWMLYAVAISLLYYILSILINNFSLFISLVILLPVFFIIFLPGYLNLFFYFFTKKAQIVKGEYVFNMRSKTLYWLTFDRMNLIYILIFSLALLKSKRRIWD